MKRTIFALATLLVVFLAVFAVLVLRPIPKVKAGHHGCSEATLSGNYGLVASGWYEGDPANVSGLVSFDGKKYVSGIFYNIVINGTPVPGAPFSFSNVSYTVTSDCAFSVTFTDPTLFSGTGYFYGTVVDTSGDQVIGNMYGSGLNVTATFYLKKAAEQAEILTAAFAVF